MKLPGDTKLTTLEIESFDGSKKLSIVNQFSMMDMYENILAPVMSCHITMYDGINLYETFPITGEEYINIEYQTDGSDRVVKYKFKLTDVSNRTIVDNGRAVQYSMTGMSEEIVKNNTTSITKRYKDTADSIVSDLLTNEIGTKKKLYKEGATKGTLDILVPRLKPFAAIDFIRRDSVSTKYDSSTFVFFENQTGFNFCTIEHLFEMGHGSAKSREYVFDAMANHDAGQNNFWNILSYRHISSGALMESLGAGQLINRSTRIDIRTGEVLKKRFEFEQKQDSFKYGDKNPVSTMSSGFQSQNAKDNGTTMLSPFSSTYPENYVHDSIGPRQSYVQALTQNIVRVFVYGNSELTAGQVITLKLPSVTGATIDTNDSKLVSGNYLVAKLRHLFVNDGGTITHTSALEGLKGSYGESE